jgi:hypothetical protein
MKASPGGRDAPLVPLRTPKVEPLKFYCLIKYYIYGRGLEPPCDRNITAVLGKSPVVLFV